MRLPKFSVSTVSLAGIVLLVGGLGIAVLGTQQEQDNRSRAAIGASCMIRVRDVASKPQASCAASEYCKVTDTRDEMDGGTNCGRGSDRICNGRCEPRIPLSACENGGGTCVSKDVTVCPVGKVHDSSLSCNSSTKICCRPQSVGVPTTNNCTDTTTKDRTCQYASCGGSSYPDAGRDSSGNLLSCGNPYMVCCQKTITQTNPPANPPPANPPPSGNTTECGPAGCCKTAFPGAKCQYTDQGLPCAGGYATNYCPRGNNYKCCKPAPADTTAPTAPALTATAVSTSQVNLSWTKSTDNVGIKNYTIFRDGTQIAVATAGATTYQDKNLNQETRYRYTVDANDAANNKTKSNEAFATTETAIIPDTIFSMELLMHGIGKAGDNRNKHGQGNTSPNTRKRNIVVQLFDPNTNQPILTKDGKVDYDSASGSYKLATLNMGNTLTTKTYVIRVNSQSLRGKVTRDITAGATNVIPVMTLINGDANWDGKLDIEDYHLINGCVRDFDLPPADCDGARAQKADLDDDGTVGIFDLNLFIRELSVQEL